MCGTVEGLDLTLIDSLARITSSVCLLRLEVRLSVGLLTDLRHLLVESYDFISIVGFGDVHFLELTKLNMPVSKKLFLNSLQKKFDTK